MKTIKCSNGCSRDIEDKGDIDPLKMCYDCGTNWMRQQYLDPNDIYRYKKILEVYKNK